VVKSVNRGHSRPIAAIKSVEFIVRKNIPWLNVDRRILNRRYALNEAVERFEPDETDVMAVPIESVIIVIRGQRAILATDLAAIYGVETRALNQAVKRNMERFPENFLFQLTRSEGEIVARSRSQFVTLKRGQNIKYLPYTFTEHGAIIAANVLNSGHAVRMSVFVVRAFVRLRRVVTSRKELVTKLEELQRKVLARTEFLDDFIGGFDPAAVYLLKICPISLW
jgi:ORF6N domain